VNDHLAAIGPHGDNHFQQPSRPIRSEVEGFVGVIVVVTDVERVFDGVTNVGILEAVIGLVLRVHRQLVRAV